MNPKVSVVLTSFNKAKYIGKAIESVLEQTYSDFELIIVDDGSSDSSQELLHDYELKDQRIKVYCFEKNMGIPSAHNYGIEQASGEYCAMIDCDDFWEKTKLEKQVTFLEEHHEYGACFSWVNIVDENEGVVPSEACEYRDLMWNSENHSQGEWLKIFFAEGCKLSNPSMVIRKKIFDEIGYYSYGLKQLQDYDLFVRILKRDNVYVFPEKLVNYRWFMGEIKNTSADNVETSSRTNFEYYLICNQFFDGMEEELFVSGFQEYFTNSKIDSKKMAFEQMLICKNYFLVENIGFAVAIKKIYDFLNDEEKRSVLFQDYGIESSYFANALKNPIFYDQKYFYPKNHSNFTMELEAELEKVKIFWDKSNNYAKELEDRLKEVGGELTEARKYIKESEHQKQEMSSELKKCRQYIEESEQQKKEIDSELKKCQQYIEESEHQKQEMSSELEKCRQYIEESEQQKREMHSELEKCRQYIEELEQRMR